MVCGHYSKTYVVVLNGGVRFHFGTGVIESIRNYGTANDLSFQYRCFGKIKNFIETALTSNVNIQALGNMLYAACAPLDVDVQTAFKTAKLTITVGTLWNTYGRLPLIPSDEEVAAQRVLKL